MIKPAIDPIRINGLLHDLFGEPPTALEPIDSGLIAQVLSFESAGKAHVIRFVTHQHAGALRKDRFIANRLASTGIPVPQITHSGTLSESHYVIAPKFPGAQLDKLDRQDYLDLIPAMIENLDQIHRVDISDTRNYGYFDAEGIGPSASWPEYLLSIKDEQPEGTFFGRWHPLFDESFMDREFFENIYGQMSALLEYCSPDRYLVHSDYGWDNVLAEDGKITAVLDWANALFGDFLYDVAYLDFYSPELDLRARFKEYYQKQNRQIENYEQRIACYHCHISLEAQIFCALTDKPQYYEWTHNRTLQLLKRD